MVTMARRRALVLLLAVAGTSTSAGAQGSVVGPRALARIVSTSPSITETLFALGLGDRVVGVSTYCRFPAAVAVLPKVGTFLKPDAERIAGLRPDLVIIHDLSNGVDRRLASLGIPFVTVERDSMASVFTSIRTIADATGVGERGAALVGTLEAQIAALRRTAAARRRPRVLFIIGRRPGALADLVAVGPGSYLDELIGVAGGENVMAIAGQPEYPRISMETVLRLDPDVIIDTVDMGDTDAERRRRQVVNERLWNAYAMLTAVKTRRLHAATNDALVVPGPRIVDAAKWIAALLQDGR